jgi:hypothetical protein
MSTATTPSLKSEPGRRTPETIKAALDAAKARHAELRRAVDRQWEARRFTQHRHAAAEAAWKTNPATQAVPFDPAAMPMLPAVPPEETAETLELHALAGEITRLEAELLAAKRALMTFA